jgi:hypothetical protein
VRALIAHAGAGETCSSSRRKRRSLEILVPCFLADFLRRTRPGESSAPLASPLLCWASLMSSSGFRPNSFCSTASISSLLPSASVLEDSVRILAGAFRRAGLSDAAGAVAGLAQKPAGDADGHGARKAAAKSRKSPAARSTAVRAIPVSLGVNLLGCGTSGNSGSSDDRGIMMGVALREPRRAGPCCC